VLVGELRRAHERAAQGAEVYGNFCDPALRNMEDFLVNARIARESTGWVFRGEIDGKFLLNPSLKTCSGIQDRIRAGENGISKRRGIAWRPARAATRCRARSTKISRGN